MLSMGSTFNTNPLALLNAGIMGQSAMPMNASITTQTTSLIPGSMTTGFVAGLNTGFPAASSSGIPQFSLPAPPSQGGSLGGIAAQLQSTGSMMLQCASMIQSLLGSGGSQAYPPAAICPYPQQPVSYAPSASYPTMPPISPFAPTPQQPMPYIPPISSLPPQITNLLSSIPPSAIPAPLTPLNPTQSLPLAPPYVYNPATPEIPPYVLDPNYSAYADPSSDILEDPTSNYEAPVYNGGDDGQYHGDPHLVGFDGEKYDVMGQPGKIYNMLSDKDVEYNTKFEEWGDNGATVIGEAAIQVGKDQIHFDRSGQPPTLNGKDLIEGQTVPLDNGGSAKWDGGKLTVDTGEYTIDLEVKEPNNPNGPYINSYVSINKGGPFSDFVAPHGLLGQTADGIAGMKNTGNDQGKQGGTVIDGTVDDYEVSDLWSHDSKFNRFGVQIGKIISNPVDGSVVKVLDTQGNVIFQAPPVSKDAAAA